jgi:thiol-disulfide isomerase/thioredoxin
MVAAVAFVLSLAAAKTPAPKPRPAEAAGVMAEVHKPGAKAVLVNVWATWCLPCREEFPDILKVAKEYAPKGLRLVLVSADFPEAEAEAQTFLTEHGVDFPTFIKAGKDEAFVNGLDQRWSGALPATFLYDKTGKVVSWWEGKATYDTLKQRVTDALETKESP